MPEAPNTERRARPRVLVFPCGTEIGLEILRALQDSTHLDVVGASSVESHHARMVMAEHYDSLPLVNDPDFLPALNRIIVEQGISLLFPAHDDVVALLAGNTGLACPVIGSSHETAAICRSKSATYARLSGIVPVPRVYEVHSNYSLPVFLKPDRGQGSKGTMLAESRAQVGAALERDPTTILIDYLPGPEYTVDCFSDSMGKLRFCGVRERIRRTNGIAVHTREVVLPDAQPMAQAIHQTLDMRGAWFFQVKLDESGQAVVMEVAPRVSGSMGLFRCQGVNLPLLAVFDALGQPVEILRQNLRLDMDRALFNRYSGVPSYGHLYIDLDDTLLIRGKLNPLVVALVVQCRNKGVGVHLLTRHASDVEITLNGLGIRGLFDEVTHLAAGQPKSAYVLQRNAILVDDSFAERREVHQSRGIPVFAPDAVEALLDWRR